MIDFFAAMPTEVRTAQRKQYRAFLAERDGEVDPHRRTLTRREPRTRSYESPALSRERLDAETFAQKYVSLDPTKDTSAEMLLLLALVKVNAAEAFGVSQSYGKAFAEALKTKDDLEMMLLIEETYHTRILLSAARLYGIEVNAPYHPPSAFRILIGSIVHAPESISRPLTLASEIIGSLLFSNLLGSVKQILKHDPELADSIEERISEVLVDELGHISFNRMCLGPLGLAQARVLMPLILRGLSGFSPEMLALGVMPRDPLSQLPSIADPMRLPQHVRSKAFLA